VRPAAQPCLARFGAMLGCALALLAAACSRSPSAGGVPTRALDAAVAHAIGDPATCLLMAQAATGRVVYRYGDGFNCARPLPACDRPGTLSAQSALPLASTPGGRFASCASVADGSRMVGWAEAKVPDAKGDLVYSAVMEGPNALPGRWINSRLADAFARAGVSSAPGH